MHHALHRTLKLVRMFNKNSGTIVSIRQRIGYFAYDTYCWVAEAIVSPSRYNISRIRQAYPSNYISLTPSMRSRMKLDMRFWHVNILRDSARKRISFFVGRFRVPLYLEGFLLYYPHSNLSEIAAATY